MEKNTLLEKPYLGTASDLERWADEYNLALFPEDQRGEDLLTRLRLACGMLREDKTDEEILNETGFPFEIIDRLMY